MSFIFVHGLGQDSKSWELVLSNLKLVSNPIVPNLNQIIHNKIANYENLYNSFCEICEKSEGPIHLCGLSLGAVLCLNYAIENPRKVASLILIAPQYKIPKTIFTIQNYIFKLMPKSLFKQMGFSKSDTLILTKSMTNLDFSENLNLINCPTMILCGDKDKLNLKTAKMLTQLIRNSKFSTVLNASHEVNIDNPDNLASLINEFHMDIGL